MIARVAMAVSGLVLRLLSKVVRNIECIRKGTDMVVNALHYSLHEL